MKIKFQYLILMLALFAAYGCKKDNYDAPTLTLKGRLVYNGEAVNVEYNKVPFELYQPGFGKTGPINGTFAQDGTYSTLLFAGDYKFTIPANQGPFRWKELGPSKRDTLAVKVGANQTLDIDVIPYYMVRNATFTPASGKLTAKFNIEKVITDANAKNIETVFLYINKTQFVSNADNMNISSDPNVPEPAIVAGSSITDLNNVTIIDDLPSITPTQNYVFARVGIKIAGVEDMIFSPLVKVSL
ncbi:DUF3823 domain-containing protein [Mucilaginibacter conchicola]|uniref:DUF3823 domain-containing protein n=1 Tax=Mucilaginibacter conchicola TaxID=2303333 RepID=A0A372NUW1_9SPHI|nr:DUF3823 domain-containing protein [Mucilaginibacter conchicola]RFZ92731.1 DUF3823 domain-containing protein [Mucilaginibacter conchicola]